MSAESPPNDKKRELDRDFGGSSGSPKRRKLSDSDESPSNSRRRSSRSPNRSYNRRAYSRSRSRSRSPDRRRRDSRSPPGRRDRYYDDRRRDRDYNRRDRYDRGYEYRRNDDRRDDRYRSRDENRDNQYERSYDNRNRDRSREREVSPFASRTKDRAETLAPQGQQLGSTSVVDATTYMHASSIQTTSTVPVQNQAIQIPNSSVNPLLAPAPEQRFLHQPPKKSGLSIEDKKKLLWGDKKVAGTNWNATEFGDSTEKDKFLRLMGAKKEGNVVQQQQQSSDGTAALGVLKQEKQQQLLGQLEKQFHQGLEYNMNRFSDHKKGLG